MLYINAKNLKYHHSIVTQMSFGMELGGIANYRAAATGGIELFAPLKCHQLIDVFTR